MKKSIGLLLIIIGGLSLSLNAQFFLGVGANAQLTALKDNYLSSNTRTFPNDEDKAQINWSPALRSEYVLSANSYLSGTFSHLSIKDYRYEVQTPSSVFTAEKVNALQGRFMAGWVFDHFGLEGGVVLIQSYQNERRLLAPNDPLSSIVEATTSNKSFTQLYPCISGTYKHGQWLGVLSGTFSSDRYSRKGQTVTTVVPQATASFGVYYLWKAVTSPRLTSPRF